MKYFLLVSLICTVLLFACRRNDKVDVIEPEINNITINGSDTLVQTFLAGDTLNISFGAADNSDLNEIRLVIHPAENGHTHNGTGHTGGEYYLNSGSWALERIFALADPSPTYSGSDQIIIPDSIAGNWHLVITALDQVGEVSAEYTVLIEVVNPQLPTISGISWPMMTNQRVVYMQPDSTFYLDGSVADPDGIDQVLIYPMSMLGAIGTIDTLLIQSEPAEVEINSYNIDQVPEGMFRVVIEATDMQGYRRLWDARIIAQ